MIFEQSNQMHTDRREWMNTSYTICICIHIWKTTKNQSSIWFSSFTVPRRIEYASLFLSFSYAAHSQMQKCLSASKHTHIHASMCVCVCMYAHAHTSAASRIAAKWCRNGLIPIVIDMFIRCASIRILIIVYTYMYSIFYHYCYY